MYIWRAARPAALHDFLPDGRVEVVQWAGRLSNMQLYLYWPKFSLLLILHRGCIGHWAGGSRVPFTILHFIPFTSYVYLFFIAFTLISYLHFLHFPY